MKENFSADGLSRKFRRFDWFMVYGELAIGKLLKIRSHIEILVKKCNFDPKFKLWLKIEIVVNNRNFS